MSHARFALGLLAISAIYLLVCGFSPKTSVIASASTTSSRISTTWLGKVRMCSIIEPQLLEITTTKKRIIKPDLKTYSIYQLRCKDRHINSTYVGRTMNIRSMLLTYRCASETNKGLVFTFIREHGGWENWEHIILEVLHNSALISVNVRKQYWMDLTKADLNVWNPIRTTDWDSGGVKKVKSCHAYKERNKDTISIKNVEYYLNNKDSINAKFAQYRLNNKDAINAKSMEYYLKNKNVISAKNRERYAEKRRQKLSNTAET